MKGYSFFFFLFNGEVEKEESGEKHAGEENIGEWKGAGEKRRGDEEQSEGRE